MAKKKSSGSFPLERVRNIGIIAHIDAGKTTTTEQILFYTGEQHRIGSVNEGNTITDHHSQEQARGITIFSANATVHWSPQTLGEAADAEAAKHRINIIDTPGHIDFTAEVERALRVLDGAVGIFCGVAGVQAQSETVWRQANTYEVPRIAYVNKLDRAGANFYDVLSDLEKSLPGSRPIPVQIPIGEEKEFRGLVDLITQRAWVWTDDDQPPPPEEQDVPDEVKDEVGLYRDQMIERLADLDEEVAEAFLSEEPLSPELLRAGLRRATLSRKAYPVLCGASFRHKGVQPLLDAVCHYLPAPNDRPPIQGKKPKGKRLKLDDLDQWVDDEREMSEKSSFCAYAFKTVSAKTTDLVYLRVYSGTASKSDQLLNVRKNQKERLGGGVYRLQGKTRGDSLEEIRAGDVVVAAGLRYTATGDTLTDRDHPILLGEITFPLPVVAMAVEPKSTKDRDDLQAALERMAKDDPTFSVREDQDTGQTVISGMGELHLEVIAKRLEEEWNIKAKVGKPRVSYKQTVQGTARATGIYEMEAGDKKMYGEVELEISPQPKALAPGGLVIEYGVSEEEFPDHLRLPTEEGLRSKATAVGHWSDPLIDCKIRVVRANVTEDASEAAFNAAASRALESAIEKAGLVSLEPVMTLTVEAPEDFFGNIVQDLQTRRAEIVSTTVVRDRHRVVAAVPLAEMFGYAGDIRSKTQGRADFSMEPRDYAQVPEGKRPKLW